MNETPFMRVVEGAASLQSICEFQNDREIRALGDNLFQAFALNQFHRDVGKILFVTHVVDGDDIGMLQSTRRLRFPVESLEQIWIVCEAGRDGFQSDESIDDRVARAVYYPHGAVAQLSEDFVLT
jgi:hypothetical protein